MGLSLLGRLRATTHPTGKERIVTLLKTFLSTRAPAATILIRLIVGSVFLSEGIQKFLFPDALGVGRFVKIGIPYPEIMAPFVGLFEIGCGSLIVLGLFTRLASIAMIINISVAIISTKIPMLLGHGFWMFNLPKLNQYGFWSMAHEARVDFAMLLGAIFLLIVGAGSISLDALFFRIPRQPQS
jgi:putative oxidoreductase